MGGSRAFSVAYYSVRPPPAPLLLVPVNRSEARFNCVAAIPQLLTTTQLNSQVLEPSAGVVQGVLHDLLTSLPDVPAAPRRHARAVRPPRSEQTERASQYSSTTPAARMNATPTFSRLSSVSSVNGDGVTRCSVATQARTNMRRRSPRVMESGLVAAGGGASEDEWAREVRALRDCHLRLVLRQLRHIVRLNRAVDTTHYNTLVERPAS